MSERRKLPAVNRGQYAVQVRLTRSEAERLERIRLSLGLRAWSDVFLHILARHRVRPTQTEAQE